MSYAYGELSIREGVSNKGWSRRTSTKSKLIVYPQLHSLPCLIILAFFLTAACQVRWGFQRGCLGRKNKGQIINSRGEVCRGLRKGRYRSCGSKTAHDWRTVVTRSLIIDERTICSVGFGFQFQSLHIWSWFVLARFAHTTFRQSISKKLGRISTQWQCRTNDHTPYLTPNTSNSCSNRLR